MAQVLPTRTTPDLQYLGAIYDSIISTSIAEQVTIADGSDVALGAKADAVATTNTGTFSLIALFKRLLNISQQSLPYGADYFIQSNADGAGNYQTIVYKTGGAAGTTVKTITLTFDANDYIVTFSEA